MIRLFTLCLYLATILPLATVGQSTIKVTHLDSSELPMGIKYSGKLKDAISWVDGLGANIVITVETGNYTNPKWKHENEGSDAELFAYHYNNDGDNLKQTWRVNDFIRDCPVDLEASFVKNTLQVTDLNKDGIGEVWIMYKTVCHGDVSPLDMKIIMYEGTQKYAMRGRNKVKVSDKDYEGGDYKFDAAFTTGPAAFRDFALKLWNKHIMQTWE